MKENAAQRNWT